MTLWRPPTSINERSIRAIRSMTNGSLDGRVVSAFPVKPTMTMLDVDDGLDDDDDPEDDVEYYPYTDYFKLDSSLKKTFKLSHAPALQEEMKAGTQNRATVHIYWNNIFQKDISYNLQGNILTIKDSKKALRSGDQITVKYWFSDEAEENVMVIPMEVWITSSPANGHSGVWGSGSTESPPTGQNGGIWKILGHVFVGINFGHSPNSGEIGYNFRIPPDVTFPADATVESAYWTIDWDRNANINVSAGGKGKTMAGKNDPPYYGERIGQSGTGEIFVGGAGCGGDINYFGTIPAWKAHTDGPFIPSAGPEDGEIFLDGADGVAALNSMKNNRTKYGSATLYQVGFRAPWNEDSACPDSGELCGCCIFGSICVDDTIYGKESVMVRTYDCKIGVTCYATLSS